MYGYVRNNVVNWIDTNGGWTIDPNCGEYKFAINQALEYIQRKGIECLSCHYPQIAERLADKLKTAKIKCGSRKGMRCRSDCGYLNPFTLVITICDNTFKSEKCPSICEVVVHELLHYTYSYFAEPDPDMVKRACCLKK